MAMRALLIFLLMACGATAANIDAQPSVAAAGNEQFFKNAAAEATGSPASADVSVETALRQCYVNRDLQCQAALTLYDRKWKAEFAERSYRWHLFSTKLIFFLVAAIVMFGLFITYVQFKRDYHDWAPHQRHSSQSASSAGGADASAVADAAASPSGSSIKLGPGTLELSSQVIGLIVLALSLGFFYLYVKEIYPMVEGHPAAVSVAPAPEVS
jgi:hypothetical protein